MPAQATLWKMPYGKDSGHDLTINFSVTTIRFLRHQESKIENQIFKSRETSRSPLKTILVKLGI